jgi:septal ring factor EnvC (AmiA/AmiB activator)
MGLMSADPRQGLTDIAAKMRVKDKSILCEGTASFVLRARDQLENYHDELAAEKDEVELKTAALKGMSKQADKLAAERDALEKSLENTVDERDRAEEALSHAYFIIFGRSPEWSNLFGHEHALEEIKDAVSALKQAVPR